jgi:hypothetical protein
MFKLIQTCFDQNSTFLSSKFFKEHMVMKLLKKGTTFSIGTSLDLKWIMN